MRTFIKARLIAHPCTNAAINASELSWSECPADVASRVIPMQMRDVVCGMSCVAGGGGDDCNLWCFVMD